MQDSSNSGHGFDPTLSKLLEAESLLSTQAAELEAQLQAMQETRKSLQTVIDMFSTKAAAGAALDEIDIPTATTAPTRTPSKRRVPSSIETAIEDDEADAPSGKSAKAEKPRRGRKAKSAAPKASKPTRGRAPQKGQAWQNYVREKFRDTSLPQAVSSVMESQPKKVFSTSEVINTVFESEMPREVRGQAQNRVSNILSTGLKTNKWHRGKAGHYSLSPDTAAADLAS